MGKALDLDLYNADKYKNEAVDALFNLQMTIIANIDASNFARSLYSIYQYATEFSIAKLDQLVGYYQLFKGH